MIEEEEDCRKKNIKKKHSGRGDLELFFPTQRTATPFLAGLAIATAALAGKYGVQAWQAFKSRPPTPRIRKFYDGGFQPTMTRREAALILGVSSLSSELAVKSSTYVVLSHPHTIQAPKSMAYPDAGNQVPSHLSRESATPDKVKEAHRRVMIANHPDAGGSDFLASKVNEAKDVMLGKTKASGSAF
eukprot:Gb_33092 [translate_table: standard]